MKFLVLFNSSLHLPLHPLLFTIVLRVSTTTSPSLSLLCFLFSSYSFKLFFSPNLFCNYVLFISFSFFSCTSPFLIIFLSHFPRVFLHCFFILSFSFPYPFSSHYFPLLHILFSFSFAFSSLPLFLFSLFSVCPCIPSLHFISVSSRYPLSHSSVLSFLVPLLLLMAVAWCATREAAVIGTAASHTPPDLESVALGMRESHIWKRNLLYPSDWVGWGTSVKFRGRGSIQDPD